MVACGWVQHDQRLMWRQSDVLSGRPIHPRVLALGQSRLLTAMCWDCVRVAGGQPWLFWRAGSASIAGIGTGLGDTLYCRPKFCAVFLCSAFCKLYTKNSKKWEHSQSVRISFDQYFPPCSCPIREMSLTLSEKMHFIAICLLVFLWICFTSSPRVNTSKMAIYRWAPSSVTPNRWAP